MWKQTKWALRGSVCRVCEYGIFFFGGGVGVGGCCWEVDNLLSGWEIWPHSSTRSLRGCQRLCVCVCMCVWLPIKALFDTKIRDHACLQCDGLLWKLQRETGAWHRPERRVQMVAVCDSLIWMIGNRHQLQFATCKCDTKFKYLLCCSVIYCLQGILSLLFIQNFTSVDSKITFIYTLYMLWNIATVG